jgi:chromosome segregation ATPase
LLVNEISNDTISKTKNSFLNDLVTNDANSRKNYEIEDKIKNEIKIKIYNLFKKKIKKNTLKLIVDQQIEIKKFQKNTPKLIVDQQIEIKKFQKKINYLNENKKALETSNHNLLSNLDKIAEDKKMLIENNKKIQEELSSQKSNFKKSNLLHNSNSGKLTELNNKLKFSQDENLRLSSEVFNSRKKYNVIKKQLYDFELQKNQLSNQIQELNDTVDKSNLVTPSFINELPSEATEDIKKLGKKNATALDTAIKKIFNKL